MTVKWNYRVFREENGDYIVREVFYGEDDSIVGCTKNSVEPWGKSLEELTRNIEWFKEGLELPVLTLADIPTPPEKLEKNRDRGRNISHDRLMAELGLTEPYPTN